MANIETRLRLVEEADERVTAELLVPDPDPENEDALFPEKDEPESRANGRLRPEAE